MRPVLVHITSYRFAPDSHPGIYRTILGLEDRATNIVIAGHDARYSDANSSDETLQPLEDRSLHVYQGTIDRLKKPWLSRHLAAGIRRRFGPVTAVIGHLGNNGWRGMALARALDTPLLTIFHGTDATVDLTGAVYAHAYQKLFEAPGAVFLAVADHLRDRLLQAGAPSERTATFHLGVDPTEFSHPREARKAGPVRLVLIGRLIPVKGHRIALQAFQRLEARYPGCELHLFGEGPLEPELRAEAERLGLTPAVQFHGAVSVHRLRDELERADLAIQPSLREKDGMVEGVPNSVIEAMAASLPVVATRHGGIPEAVIDGETGRLVEEGSPTALSAALIELAADPAQRAKLGRDGRARVEACFDMRTQGAELARHCEAAAVQYRSLGAIARRVRWRRACRDVVDTTGRRQRLEWELRTLLNHVQGRIP